MLSLYKALLKSLELEKLSRPMFSKTLVLVKSRVQKSTLKLGFYNQTQVFFFIPTKYLITQSAAYEKHLINKLTITQNISITSKINFKILKFKRKQCNHNLTPLQNPATQYFLPFPLKPQLYIYPLSLYIHTYLYN